MKPVYFAKPNVPYQERLQQELQPLIKPGQRVAIKLHMGEPGNSHALAPDFTRQIVQVVQALGGQPFLFDSPVAYPGPRSTAASYVQAVAQHGYSPKAMGCPIVVSDDAVTVRVSEVDFDFGVCKTLVEADFVLVLSHVKGHICSGFGGAIKNLGMGAMNKATKSAIHKGGKPVVVGECSLCGACVQACPLDNVRLDETEQRPHFDRTWCCGCSDCVYACPNQTLKCEAALFDRLLAAAAKAALSRFKGYYFVNVVRNIAKECDCLSTTTPLIAKDVGLLWSQDIVAVEQASLDLVQQQEGHNVFLDANKKSPQLHISEAEKLGMGATGYQLVALG